jgi:23S rRNA (pseudouridine1915-N3)-methyltransferase
MHLITVGTPKLQYAKIGWEEYIGRLKHYHTVRLTHLSDKQAYTPQAFTDVIGNSFAVALDLTGTQLSSEALSTFLNKRAVDGREISFIIGGPEGIPRDIVAQAHFVWSLSDLTFPHDLAMLVMAETLYRSSTISAGIPYHK